MCGIAGFINFKKSFDDDTIKNVLEKMNKCMAYRGPDHVGIYNNSAEGIGLTHLRLSIIDLSPLGHQPMSLDNRYHMIFNGEIYNYRTIREELIKRGYSFRSNSDSEVLLAAFKEYGTACFSMLNGMFVIAIWDDLEKKMTLARDRTGIKPLYFRHDHDSFVFASEIKSILRYPGEKISVNEEAIYNYFTVGHQIDQQTWYKNIYLMRPGSYIVVSSNKNVVEENYYDPRAVIDYNRSFTSFKDELRETIIDAIRLHQIGDVPVGAHLSGGIDSSTIVSIAAGMHDQPLHTFSSTFLGIGKEYDESREIDEVRKKFGTMHHKVVTDPNEIPAVLSKLVYHMDEPEVGPALIPSYFVNKEARRNNIIVVNGGHGVDELFGGYPPNFTLAAYSHLALALKDKKKFILPELLRIPSYLHKGGSFKRMLKKAKSEGSVQWLRRPEERTNALNRYTKLFNFYKQDNTSFDANMMMMLKHYLPGLLHVEDRMSMASSLESRVPFLDYRLVELALKIPFYYKVGHGRLKYIFREAMKGIVPDMILENKVKRGFPTPIAVWSKNQLVPFYKEKLTKKDLLIAGIVDKAALEKMLNLHINNQADFTSELWACLMTELWMENNLSVQNG